MYANFLDMAFSQNGLKDTVIEHPYLMAVMWSVSLSLKKVVLCEPLRSNPDKRWELCYGNVNRNYGVIEQMSFLALIGLKNYLQLYTLMPFFSP